MARSKTLDIEEVLGDELNPNLARLEGVLRAIADADIRDIFNAKGEQLSVKKWPDSVIKAVQRVNVSASGALNVTFYDRQKAAHDLARIEELKRKSSDDELFSKVDRDEVKLIRESLIALASDPDLA